MPCLAQACPGMANLRHPSTAPHVSALPALHQQSTQVPFNVTMCTALTTQLCLPASRSRQHASVLQQTAHLSNGFQLHHPDAPPYALQPGMHTRLSLPAEPEASACMVPFYWLSNCVSSSVTGSRGELVQVAWFSRHSSAERRR